MMRFKRTGEIEYDLTKTKKKAFAEALKKKNEHFLPFYQTLFLFSRLFPGLENCSANFKTFSRIQDSVRTLHLKTAITLCNLNRQYLRKF